MDKSLPFPALGSSHSVKCLDNNCSTRQQGRPPRKALDVNSFVRPLCKQSSWESPWNLLSEAIPVTILTWLWLDFSPCPCSLFAGSQHNLRTDTSWALVSLWELTLHGWFYHCNFWGGVVCVVCVGVHMCVCEHAHVCVKARGWLPMSSSTFNSTFNFLKNFLYLFIHACGNMYATTHVWGHIHGRGIYGNMHTKHICEVREIGFLLSLCES